MAAFLFWLLKKTKDTMVVFHMGFWLCIFYSILTSLQDMEMNSIFDGTSQFFVVFDFLLSPCLSCSISMPNFSLREKKSIFIPKTEKEIERWFFVCRNVWKWWNGVKRSGHQAYLCIVVDFSICHNCQFLVPAQPRQHWWSNFFTGFALKLVRPSNLCICY